MTSLRLFLPVSLLRQSLHRSAFPSQLASIRHFNSKLSGYLPFSDQGSSYYRRSSQREASLIDLPRIIIYAILFGLSAYGILTLKRFYRKPLFDGQKTVEDSLNIIEIRFFRWILNAFCSYKYNEVLKLYEHFEKHEHKYSASEYLPLKAIVSQFRGITKFRLKELDEAEKDLHKSMGYFKESGFRENDLAVILNTLYLSLITLLKGDDERAYKGLLFCTSSMLRFRSAWRKMEQSELQKYGFVALSCYSHFIRHASANREKFKDVDFEFLDDVVNEAQSLAHACAHDFKHFFVVAPYLQSDFEALYIMIINDILYQKLNNTNYEEKWARKLLSEIKETQRGVQGEAGKFYRDEALMCFVNSLTFRAHKGDFEKPYEELKTICETAEDAIVKKRAIDQMFEIWFKYQRNV